MAPKLTVLRQQQRLIAQVTERINRGSTLEDILKSLFEQLNTIIPCNRLSVGLLEEDEHTLVLGPVQSDGKVVLTTGYRESIEGSSLKPLMEKGETRIINDLDAYIKKKPNSNSTKAILREGMKSSLTVPLVVADKRVGVMWFSSREKNAYSKEHEEFMKTIAGHLAFVIEKDQLVRGLQRDVRQAHQRQDILLEIAKVMHSTLDLGPVFRKLVKTLKPIVKFDRASILLLSEGGRTLRFRELEPRERKYLGRTSEIPVEGSAAGQAIQDRKPLYTPDLKKGSTFYEDVLLRRDAIRTRVCLPLFVQRRPIGTLNLASRKPDRFSDEDIEFLTQVAEQVSVAVANSEAYAEADRLRTQLESENIQLREFITSSRQLSELIGESPAWMKILQRVEMVAPTDSTVLISGETGTGKELIARAIHRLSQRNDHPFVVVSCAGLPRDLIATELFGQEKKRGRIQLAEKGTLFLDEVSALPLDVQVQLLRVLEEREFTPLGGLKAVKPNVRIVAATNRNLAEESLAGTFRDDLYMRLNVVPILVPPLRGRTEDIEPLLMYFLRRYAQKVGKRFDQVDRGSVERCLSYSWPGNVRELENLVERSVILSPGPVFTMDPRLEADALAGQSKPNWRLDEAVRAHLTHVLRMSGGKIYGENGAAKLLGLKPSTLQAKLKKLGLDRKQAAGR